MNIPQHNIDFRSAGDKPSMNVVGKPSFNLKEGQLFKAQVLSADGDKYSVRVGRNQFNVESSIPLTVGDRIEAQSVRTPEGQISLQLMNIARFSSTRITDLELIYQLQSLKFPPSAENLAIARVLLEFQLPLSFNILTVLRQALAQLPRMNSMDIYSASFLKQSNLPLNPKNITGLSNFLSSHPLIGSELFQLQSDLRKLSLSSSDDKFGSYWKFISKLPAFIGEMVIEQKLADQKMLMGKLFKLAQQAGIEEAKAGTARKLDFGKIINFLDGFAAKLPDGAEKNLVLKITELFGRLAGQFLAMGLINQAEKGEVYNYWYFQIPFMLGGDSCSGELKITYRHDLGPDPANIKIDFVIKTKNLGDMRFDLNILNSIIEGKIQVKDFNIKGLVDSHIAELEEALRRQNYQIGKLYTQATLPDRLILDLRREQFETMQNVDVSV